MNLVFTDRATIIYAMFLLQKYLIFYINPISHTDVLDQNRSSATNTTGPPNATNSQTNIRRSSKLSMYIIAITCRVIGGMSVLVAPTALTLWRWL